VIKTAASAAQLAKQLRENKNFILLT